MRISYSGLDAFASCPAKYKYQYIDRIKAPKSKEAVFGTLIHECLKLFHEPSRPIPLSEDELLKIYTQKWDSSVYNDKQEEAFVFHQGIEILKNYYYQNQGKSFNIINLETPFEASIKHQNEFHQITGRIDRIDKLSDGSFEVIDYKTSKKMPGQSEIDNNFQLSVYYLGVINRWPSLKEKDKPIKLSLYYLKHGEKLSTIQTGKKIKENKERILELIDQLQQSNFEPVLNPLCDWCPYQRYCSLFRHKFIQENSPAPDQEQIQQIIKEYFKIKEQQAEENKKLAQLKEQINEYCDQHNLDRLFAEDGYISRSVQKRYDYDPQKLKEILEPLGKWNEILRIDAAKFKQVYNSLPYQIKRQIQSAKISEKEFKVISTGKNKNYSK